MARVAKKEKAPKLSALELAAEAVNETPAQYCATALREPRGMTVTYKGNPLTVMMLPGTTLSGRKGPGKPASIMLVGRCPGAEESLRGRLDVGFVHGELLKLLKPYDLDLDQVYLTNVLRFAVPRSVKTPPKQWFSIGKAMLDMEVQLINPSVILAMGTDAIKCMTEREESLQATRGATLLYRGIPVVPTYSPAVLQRELTVLPGLQQDVSRMISIYTGEVSVERDCNYVAIETEAHLIEVVNEHLTRPELRYGVDCEWGGTNGTKFTRDQLRCIQFTCRTHEAYRIVLRREGLVSNPELSEPVVARELSRLFCRPGVMLGGHNFRSDLKRLERIGVMCAEQFIEGGLDTMLAYHLAFQSKTGNGLEQLALRYTDLGRYDRDVMLWLKDNGYGEERLDKVGYADIPEDLLHPYACKDPDVVLRAWDPIVDELKKQLISKPYRLFGEPIETMWDLYRNIVHPVNLPIHEMECTGLYTDIERLKFITGVIHRKADVLSSVFQETIQWPGFNYRSDDDIRELLFGYVPGKACKHPADAKIVGAFPVKTTEKPSRDWDRVSDADKQSGMVAPATDSETIEILMDQAKEAGDKQNQSILQQLHHLKIIDQLVKNFLRAPVAPEDGGEPVWCEGLVNEIDQDMRTRTEIGQITDTGRGTSSNPNLQNLPKKQEKHLRQIFSPDVEKLLGTKGWDGMGDFELKELGLLDRDYFSIRTCYMASPGNLLVEADYSQAELNVLAHMAGDEDMLAVLNDPKRDLHSEMAVKAFKLDCKPQDVSKLHPSLRVAAKATLFGLLYGRGAGAIARQLHREGINLTRKEAQAIIDAVYNTFKKLKAFVQKCHDDVDLLKYVENAFGRRRYFAEATDESLRAAYHRQGQNSPIQGTVGDALNIALVNLHHYRLDTGMQFKLVLPVHDAIFFDTPVDEVIKMRDEVIPVCMGAGVAIPNTQLIMRVDIAIMKRWGEKFKTPEALANAMELARRELLAAA